jgi:hypothetical protein
MENNCLEVRKIYRECCIRTEYINCRPELDILHDCLLQNYYRRKLNS